MNILQFLLFFIDNHKKYITKKYIKFKIKFSKKKYN